jgi:hypothetical protein
MVSQCGHYTGLCAVRNDGETVLEQRTGQWTPELKDRQPEMRNILGKIEKDTIYIRMKVPKTEDVSFEISYDGEEFSPVGEAVHASPGRWVGVKAGLFAINEKGALQKQDKCGEVTADYFVFEK